MKRTLQGTLQRVLAGSLSASLLLLASGCVERLLLVRSDPPGAIVHINGEEVGVTPLEHRFTFYGTYDVQLRRTGYRAHREPVAVRPPWYEVFPLDFVSELLVPWTLRDRHEVEVELVEAPPRFTEGDEEAMRARAATLRQETLERSASR